MKKFLVVLLLGILSSPVWAGHGHHGGGGGGRWIVPFAVGTALGYELAQPYYQPGGQIYYPPAPPTYYQQAPVPLPYQPVYQETYRYDYRCNCYVRVWVRVQ